MLSRGCRKLRLIAPAAGNQTLEQEAQLKARIQQEQAMISVSAREERDGKLISWGVAVEQLLADDTFQAEWRKVQCQRVLSGRTLERALVQKLAYTRDDDVQNCSK